MLSFTGNKLDSISLERKLINISKDVDFRLSICIVVYLIVLFFLI